MCGIQIIDVSKRFGKETALEGIILQIQPGECLVLFGGSGAGKTTLLRIIAGLELPEAGTVQIDKREVAKRSADRRSVSLLGQDAALYPQLSVEANLHAAIKKLGLSAAESASRIEVILDQFSIAKLRSAKPGQISGGEAQRVAFARALISEPQVLLLDEPLSHLDRVTKDMVVDLLTLVRREYDPTIVLVVHDPLDAMQLGDRIAILHQGKLIEAGTPQQLYQAPRHRITGSLLSTFGMNWLENYRLDPSDQFQIAGDVPNTVGFRPEHVQLEVAPASSSTNRSAWNLPFKSHNHSFVGIGWLHQGEIAGQPVKVLAQSSQLDLSQHARIGVSREHLIVPEVQ